MNLKNYSKEQLETIINSLIERELINESEIIIEPTVEERNAATMLHTIMCRLSHETECAFYVDDKEFDRWIMKVRKFCDIYKQAPGDILVYINKLKELLSNTPEPYLVILSLFCLYHDSTWNVVQVIDSI